MRVTFLGTGTSQGVPVITCTCEVCQSKDPRDKRLRCSVLIQQDGTNVVIDSGPDFRQQMLSSGISHLNAIVYTHNHKDHIAGMDDVRGFNYGQKSAVDLYCNEDTLQALKREFFYAFEEIKYPGVPEVNVNLIRSSKPFQIGNLPFQPIEVIHYRLPVLAYRIHDFVYITDANFISDTEKEKAYGAKVLVINALRKTEHISHFSLDQAIDMAKELNAETTYFIHLSHQMGLHEEVQKELPPNMFLAYDGLVLEGL